MAIYISMYFFILTIFLTTYTVKSSNLLVNVESLVIGISGVPQSLSGEALHCPQLLSHVRDLNLKDSDLESYLPIMDSLDTKWKCAS